MGRFLKIDCLEFDGGANDQRLNYLEKEENIIKEVCLKEFKKIYNVNKNKYDFEYDFN